MYVLVQNKFQVERNWYLSLFQKYYHNPKLEQTLTLFRLGGGGGLFEPPLRQNRDNFYTERAMTFKFSDFSKNLSRNILV